MSTKNIIVGKQSELLSAFALLKNGYDSVAFPVTEESFDIIARNIQTRLFETFQVKTAFERPKRNAIVVFAKKGDGSVYTKEEADHILGVRKNDVYLIENRELGEYWATPKNIDKKWRRLT